MRAPWALVILLGATAGCDRVFGLETRPADAAVVEQPVSITDLRIVGTPPTIEDTREVRATVHGPPGSRQTYVFSVTAGMLSLAGGATDLDDAGEAEISASYQPARPGLVTLAAMAGSASTSVSFAVLDLVTVGRDNGTGKITHGVGRYVGARITLGQASELRAVGLLSTATAGTMGKFAVYTELNGYPAARVAELSTAQPVPAGLAVFPIPFLMLPAGDYWLVAIFDRDLVGFIEYTGLSSYGSVSGVFTDPMPTNLPGFGTTTGDQLAFFMKVVPQ